MKRDSRERVSGLQEQVNNRGAGGGEPTIQVFINETDSSRARYATYKESDVVPQARRSNSAGPRPRAPSAGAKPLSRGSSGTGRPSGAGTPGVPGKRGTVPKYLQNRKAELAAEKEMIRRHIDDQAEVARCPPGTMLMPEEDKKAAIAALERRKAECEDAMIRMPMRFDTMSMANKKKQLESEIQECEAAIKRFSRKEVFIPK